MGTWRNYARTGIPVSTFFSNSRTGSKQAQISVLNTTDHSVPIYSTIETTVQVLVYLFFKYILFCEESVKSLSSSWRNVRNCRVLTVRYASSPPRANRFRGLPKQFFGERCGNRDCYALSKKKRGV